jgi:hypothetical protein
MLGAFHLEFIFSSYSLPFFQSSEMELGRFNRLDCMFLDLNPRCLCKVFSLSLSLLMSYFSEEPLFI